MTSLDETRAALRRLVWVAGGLAVHNVVLWALYKTVPIVTWGARPGAAGLLGLRLGRAPYDLMAPLALFAAIAILLDMLSRAGEEARRAEGEPGGSARAWASRLHGLAGTTRSLAWALGLAGLFLTLGGLGAFGARWVLPMPRLAALGPGAVIGRVYDDVEGRATRPEEGLSTLQVMFDAPGRSLFEELDADVLREMQTDWTRVPPGAPRWRPEPWEQRCQGVDPEESMRLCFGDGGSAQMIEHLSYVVLGDVPPWDGLGKPPCRSAWDSGPQDGAVAFQEFGGEAFGLGASACAMAGLVRTDWVACRGCVHPPDFGAWDPVAGARLFQRLARLHGGHDPEGLTFDSRDMALLYSKWTLLPVFWGLALVLTGLMLSAAVARARETPLADHIADPEAAPTGGRTAYRGRVDSETLSAGLFRLKAAAEGVDISPVPGLRSLVREDAPQPHPVRWDGEDETEGLEDIEVVE